MHGTKFQKINTIVLILFSLWFIILGYQNIFEPFVADDLHLIRKYSSQHLLNVWFSNWDPDNIETVSYRPLAIWYYHLQSVFFGENTIILTVFIYITQFILLIIILYFFKKLNFSNTELFFLFSFLIFSKIFTTIVTWKTLNPLIFCYINFFLTSIFFLKWIDKGKFKDIALVIFFSFLSIFSREEIYHLPFYLIFLALFYIKVINFEKLKKILIAFFSVLFIVVLHYSLRSNLVEGASEIKITISGIKGILLSGLASGLPGGLITTNLIEIILQVLWILPLLILFLLYVIKNIADRVEIKKFLTIFFIICILISPSMIIIRDFGIFLPSVFTYGLIAIILSNVLKNLSEKKILKNTILCIIFLTFISGVVGGLYRSLDHINVWKHNSLYNLVNDSVWVYGYSKSEVTIPDVRRALKKKQLKEYGIFEKLNYDDLILKINKKEINKEILIPRHFPLKY